MIQVLDKGFVSHIDHMGSDRRIAEAAWVSTAAAEGRPDTDVARLLGYLARENHWTPFGHAVVTLHLHWPLFVARQGMRSTVGMVWNEESRRYIDTPPAFYHPTKWRSVPAKSIKQGSGPALPLNLQTAADAVVRGVEGDQMVAYNRLIDLGVAKEQARIVLPQSMYTQCYLTASLAALARFCKLRADHHAQWEIQQYAHAISTIVSPLFPVAWRCLMGQVQEITRNGTEAEGDASE